MELVRLFNWLAPSTVCMLLALAVLRQEGAPGSPVHNPIISTLLSNQTATAYVANGSDPLVRNILSATFEFTNRNGSTFNTSFTPFTNQ